MIDRRLRLSRGWLLLLLAIVLILSGIFFARHAIFRQLGAWTGEEDHWEQVKGSVALLLLYLTDGFPDTAPYVPVAHAGVNPFGVNTFLEQEVEPEKVDRALVMIADAGFRWIRQEFPWEDIEISAKGDFWDHKWDKSAWEKYDRIVELANRHGLQIIARLDNPPDWSRAAGAAAGTLAPPDRYEDFGDFVYAVVSRYRGRIRYYQIWNEPNIYPEWGEQPVNAAEYVALLKVAYTRAKEADPECMILSAGLAQTLEKGPRNLDDTIYLQQMYDAGAKDYFDILGVMAYGLWTGPDDRRVSADRTNFARPQLIREIMVRNGDAGKAIWVTEVGWNALPLDFPDFPMFGRVTPEQQARYAVRAYARANAEWPWMGVLNYWFFKRPTDTEKDQAFYYFRLVEPDFTPLPVYEALRAYANQPGVLSLGYHQEDHWALQYEGSWRTVSDTAAVLGAYRLGQPGDRLSFTFSGNELTLITRAGAGGTLHIALDGRALPPVHLPQGEVRYETQVPLARALRDGTHQVELVIAAAGDKGVVVDGLLVRRTWDYWTRRGAVALAALSLLVIGVGVFRRRGR